ncbi:putative alpha/beta hydrolase domain-containing protein [Cladophialophora immunda]|nr:putative alpha/beta hydrolase domain-containing protein [Cladophialophora immunda]
MAVGQGIDENIKAIYNALAPLSPAQAQRAPPDAPPRIRNGDTLCFFGFSRGAATARLAADFIATVGFLSGGPNQSFNVNKFFTTWAGLSENSRYRDPQSYPVIHPRIECVAVFDTVEALTVPRTTQQRARPGVPPTIPTLSTKAKLLHPSIPYGFQALALHEMRNAFLPEVWGPPKALGQRIQQTWFIGKHSDIGGGPPSDAPDAGLASEVLRWMVARTEAIGIGFAATEELNHLLSIPESEAGQGHVRNQGTISGAVMGGQTARTPGRYQPNQEQVHISVRNRGQLNLQDLPPQPPLVDLIGQPEEQQGGAFIWINGDVRMPEDTLIAPPEGSTTTQTTSAPRHPLPSVSNPAGGVPRPPGQNQPGGSQQTGT